MAMNLGPRLTGNMIMNDGDWLTSDGEFYTLRLQSGQLSLISLQGLATPIAGAALHPGDVCCMQAGGNLVIGFPPAGAHPPHYASGTGAFAGAQLILEDTGQAIIFDALGTIRWINGVLQQGGAQVPQVGLIIEAELS
jgi:hypothetical protein